jgi:hypothetical protein
MTSPDRPSPEEVRAGIEQIDAAIGDISKLGPGELVVAWVVLAATRTPGNGGQVLRILSDESMPPWQVKGILDDGRDDVANDQYNGANSEPEP